MPPSTQPVSGASLGVEVSVPKFGQLLDEKNLDADAAWSALAGEAQDVDFNRFSVFAFRQLGQPLNITQAWWVFSELDENQDLTLRKLEFLETLSRAKLPAPPSLPS